MNSEAALTRVIASKPFNLVINNFFWIGCVVGRYEWIWLVAPAVIAYALFLIANHRIQPLQLCWPVFIGILIDSILTASGFFQFPQNNLLLPLWMCVLWLAFATTLPMSLNVVGNNIYLAAATGAIGFPFSYLLGARLGAVSFGLPTSWTAIILAVTWALLLPILFKLINTNKRVSSETA